MSERKKIKMDSWWEDSEYDPGHDLDMPEGTTKELRESNSLLDFSGYFLSDSENEDTDSENEEDDEETTFNAVTTLTPEEDLLESRIIINTSNTTIHKKLKKDGPIIDIAPGMYLI